MGPGRTLGMPGGTWLDPGGMPGGTLVAPFRTLFRLVVPGHARWDLGNSPNLSQPKPGIQADGRLCTILGKF